MSEAKIGKSKILLFRDYDKRATENAKVLALQTKHTIEYSTENSDVVVKTLQGSQKITKTTSVAQSIDLEFIYSDDALSQLFIEILRKQGIIECWEVDLSTKTSDGKYKAEYFQGTFDGLKLPAEVEDFISVSTKINVNYLGKFGNVELTSEQEEEIDYVFHDLKPTTTE